MPSYTIKALARYWGKRTVSIAIGNGGPGIRGPYATEPARLQVLLLAMQGVGKPGVHQFKMIEWGLYNKKSRNPLPGPKYYPALLGANRGWKYTDTPPQFIPKDLIHEAILNPPINWYGTTLSRDNVEQQFIKYTYPREGGTEIHMIWTDTPSWVTCWNDTNSYVRALQNPKIEFVLAQHPWMENDCMLADLVLPSLTVMETDDIGTEAMSGQFHCLFYQPKAIQPRGESKSDYEIVCADRRTVRHPGGIHGGQDCQGVDQGRLGEFRRRWRDHLRQAQAGGVLRRPAGRGLAEEQSRAARFLRGSGEEPPHHPQREDRVLFLSPG